MLVASACTERCAGKGELLFALIHCGPILPDPAEGVNRQFLPFSGGFGLTSMAWAGGRGRTVRQCASSGAVLQWTGHEKASAKQKSGSKPPTQIAVLNP